MEQAKHAQPKFSEAFKELATYLSGLRKSIAGDSSSRISSLGGFMRSWLGGKTVDGESVSGVSDAGAPAGTGANHINSND